MADPVLDEDNILHLLSLPVTRDHFDGIQAGAVQALCDLYDRKVTRDEFVANAGPVLVLYGQCAKLWMLYNVRDVVEHDGALHEQKLQEAMSGLSGMIREQSEKIKEIIRRLKLCPLSEDKVH